MRPQLLQGVVLLFCAAAATNTFAQDEGPITDQGWTEAVISVSDLNRSASFFQDIGSYKRRWRGKLTADLIASWGLPEQASGEALLLQPDPEFGGMLRLVRFDNAGRREPMRPGARTWDSGCYFSVMARMKNMQAIYDDAIAMGWWTETPITDLSFGTSKLKVVIYRGPDGVQVQGYERLSPPLPAGIPDFDRISGPFNMMQMVRDRDVAYDFFTEVLGFETFYKGDPFVADEPRHSPLGIPLSLTTTHRYRAGIVYPVPGESGRMEMIEHMDLRSRDHSQRCDPPNLGILAVRFPVASLDAALARLEETSWPVWQPVREAVLRPYGKIRLVGVKTPDGAIIQFFEDMP